MSYFSVCYIFRQKFDVFFSCWDGFGAAAQHWQRLLSFSFIGLNFEPLFSSYWTQFAALSFFLMGSISNPSFFFMGLVLSQHLHSSWWARFWCPMNLRCMVP
jgi:hypothetical protein